MGIERGGLKGFRSGWSVPPKPCDSCKLASAALFCRPDSAFLCIACDSKIHCANKLSSRHERVWMCEVCEQAPAAVTCKADAAALCVTCDSDIHSANPLARRHDRIPVEPFFDSAESIVKASAASFSFVVPTDGALTDNGMSSDGFGNDESAWLIPNPNFGSKLLDAPDMKSREMFFSEMDPFLDFDYSNSFQNNNNNVGNDSVVPVQTKPPAPVPVMNENSCFDIDFCRSKLSSFNYRSQSISQSVSSSSLDVGVVPDGNTVSDMSYSFGRNCPDSSGMVTPVGSSGVATQLCGMDREARVLRYREKRKNRKFEKTIRYASRKAYAETRPRIKGRFAKRTEIESEVDHLYSPGGGVPGSLLLDTQYGVVPSF